MSLSTLLLEPGVYGLYLGGVIAMLLVCLLSVLTPLWNARPSPNISTVFAKAFVGGDVCFLEMVAEAEHKLGFIC